MNHEDMKQSLIEEGKRLGYKPNELRVLSTDPYFVGTEKDYVDANWIASLWDKMMSKRKKPIHLRGFHYWIMSNRVRKPDGNFYTEPDPAKDWGYLLHSAQVARYLGIGGWENLLDLKHPDPNDYDLYWVGSGIERDGNVDVQNELNMRLSGIVEEFMRGLYENIPRYHTSGYQLYHLEVWCEKNSMGFVINPPCRKYEACYQPLVGQSSVEKVNMSAERAIKAAKAGKKVRIFYISDFDRYGCFAGSTIITTNRNEARIRDIKVGDELVTFDKAMLPVITKVQAIDTPWVPISSMILLKIEGTSGVNRGKRQIVRTMIVSKRHPIHTLNRGYVNVEELSTNDILLDAIPLASHFKNIRPRPSNSNHRKELIANDFAFRQKMIDSSIKGANVIKEKYGGFPPQANEELKRIRSEEPERWIEIRRKNMESIKKLPSGLELRFIEKIKDLPIEYTGNGKLFVKGFCPDFRVTGRHKLIELSQPKFLESIGRDYEKYKRERQKAYTKGGYEVLFLAYEGKFESEGNFELLVEKTKTFVVNGAKLISKEEINTEGHLSRLSHMGELRKVKSLFDDTEEWQIKVYNLYCEPYNTFVASGVVVHNWSMVSAVARKLEFFVKEHDLDIKLTRLALSEEQIKKFNLPKAPKHGEEVVELDALEAIYPGELGKIVEDALSPYYDKEKVRIVEEENRRVREKTRKLIEDKLKVPLEEAFTGLSLEGIVGDFNMREGIDKNFEPPVPSHEVKEQDNWMYDSHRDYFEQLNEYKKYKLSREEEEV